MTALFVVCIGASAAPVTADPWAAPGDARLRHDLQLLADAGIVKAPLTSWPVSCAEVTRDLASASNGSLPAHVGAALAPDVLNRYRHCAS